MNEKEKNEFDTHYLPAFFFQGEVGLARTESFQTGAEESFFFLVGIILFAIYASFVFVLKLYRLQKYLGDET